MAVSFDLFGTLVDIDRPKDPAEAVAAELGCRGVAVPDDWASAYRECHVDAPAGAEVPLSVHIEAALRSRGIDPPENTTRRATAAAFDPAVRTRPGAKAAVEVAKKRGPLALCSNCSIPGVAQQALARSAVDCDAFDAIVTSVDCGWRKPDERIFETVADALSVRLTELVHVGDDPVTDGGIEDVGGRAIVLEAVDLHELPAIFDAGRESA